MRRQAGLTLVELLIALFAMSVLAMLSWRGLDGMSRAQAITEARADEVLTLQTGLAQWGADLEAMEQVQGRPVKIDWNGRVLRLTRHSSLSAADGVRVVGWTRREGQWRRWESPPVATRGDLDQAWRGADLWAQNQGGGDAREVVVVPLEDWQVFFFRENAWTNPQSSDIATRGTGSSASTAVAAPDGVRIVLVLPQSQAVAGVVTRDWVSPQVVPQQP